MSDLISYDELNKDQKVSAIEKARVSEDWEDETNEELIDLFEDNGALFNSETLECIIL